jgi:hypothetical protein
MKMGFMKQELKNKRKNHIIITKKIIIMKISQKKNFIVRKTLKNKKKEKLQKKQISQKKKLLKKLKKQKNQKKSKQNQSKLKEMIK